MRPLLNASFFAGATKAAIRMDFKIVFAPSLPSPAIQWQRIVRFLSGMLIGD